MCSVFSAPKILAALQWVGRRDGAGGRTGKGCRRVSCRPSRRCGTACLPDELLTCPSVCSVLMAEVARPGGPACSPPARPPPPLCVLPPLGRRGDGDMVGAGGPLRSLSLPVLHACSALRRARGRARRAEPAQGLAPALPPVVLSAAVAWHGRASCSPRTPLLPSLPPLPPTTPLRSTRHHGADREGAVGRVRALRARPRPPQPCYALGSCC